MKIEQIERKIVKIKEKLEKSKEGRMVPYRDFIEGNGKYGRDLEEIRE